MRARHLWIPLVCAAAFGTFGCGAVRDLSKADTDRSAGIEAKIAQARDMNAVVCAPVELAAAETALARARHEAMEFEPAAVVARYFDTSDQAADRLLAKTKPCYEQAQRRNKDSDGDGVPDYRDQCPGTRRGLAVDERGCALDADRDGVPDGQDTCPGTPAGVKVDNRGCALDTDHDGVADHLDHCPGTPGGVRVDARGCPVDTDGDGVTDNLDTCPGTPKGAPVDRTGCLKDSDGDGLTDWAETRKHGTDPANPDTDGDRLRDGDEVNRYRTDPTKADTDGGSVPDGLEVNVAHTDPLDPGDDVKEIKRAELKVLFATNSADVEAAYLPEIEAVARFLKEYPHVHVAIEGHTDSRGSEAYNRALSQRRADSVVKVLVDRYGIAASRLEAKGFGETRPIASNDTQKGRAKNRRIYAVMTSE